MAETRTRAPRLRGRLVAAGLLACAGAVTVGSLLIGAAQPAVQPYDFNGDGIADLAIGVPGNVVGGKSAAGSVVVANGTSNGPAGSSVRIDQESPGVAGAAEADDSYGSAFASADFDGDGYADLAVSAPLEAIGDTQGAGFVIVHYGSSGGVHGSRSTAFDEDTAGIPGAPGWDELFGYSLAAGDLNGDGYADLVVGQPLDHVDGHANAGSLRIVFGSASGLDTSSAVWIDQSTPNVPGTPEDEDRFGEQLAIGDIDGDGNADLVVTTLGEQISGSSDRGSVHVLYGPVDDAPAAGGYIDSAHIDGIGEFSGSALALGHFNDDAYLDVAIGVSDQKVDEDGAAGRLAVLYADADGLSHEDVEVFDQDTPGIAGGPEPEDYFASSLAAGDFDGDGVDDLVVGMRSEAIGSAKGSGASLVLFGNATGGITASGAVWIDQDTAGVPGTVWEGDHFGWTVGALDTDGDGRDEPLIGAPGNAAGTVTVVKVRPGDLESATALAEADLGWPAGSDGDAFGITLPR
ncbi:FG-GAP repeat protein [Streptomyces sp. NPDC047968]|uniref:FG-GAP repeat protein n=1 Tax=unclassified Streptomyces TaxID=2593676 RepID=UPI003420E820